MSDEWVDKLRAGDLVIVSDRYDVDTVRRVDKITKTQITVGNQIFMRKSLRLKGADCWNLIRLKEAEPGLVERIKRKKECVRMYVTLMNYVKRASYDQLKKLSDVIRDEITEE